jgi:hypothetical protein
MHPEAKLFGNERMRDCDAHLIGVLPLAGRNANRGVALKPTSEALIVLL